MDLALENVRALTMDPRQPVAGHVGIQGDRIASVGPGRLPTSAARKIDCQGMTLVPGFNDAHLHLMAYVSSLLQVDCRPGRVSSIADIVKALRERAARTPPGQCIRAFGYDEFYLAEARHPHRHDLDAATRSHPVRLDHRTGHASVLNTAALARLDIGPHTPDPVDGVIDRDEATGQPTGLLFEMSRHLRPLSGQPGPGGPSQGLALANAHLLAHGVTSVQDAGPSNDPDRWHVLRKLKEEGAVAPRLHVMRGAAHLEDFDHEGLFPGDDNHDASLGSVKLILSFTTGTPQPAADELARLVEEVHRDGHQLAIHAVEQEAVELAASCLLQAQRRWPRPDARHRIEHCCECTMESATMLAQARAMVATQPAFTYDYGEKYLKLAPAPLHPHLYPLERLRRAGVHLAAGSDAPVDSPNPLRSIHASCARRTMAGTPFNPDQALSAYHALRMETLGGAYASFQEAHKGSIEVGKLADLALLDGQPGQKDARVVMTMIGGRVVWEA